MDENPTDTEEDINPYDANPIDAEVAHNDNNNNTDSSKNDAEVTTNKEMVVANRDEAFGHLRNFLEASHLQKENRLWMKPYYYDKTDIIEKEAVALITINNSLLVT